MLVCFPIVPSTRDLRQLLMGFSDLVARGGSHEGRLKTSKKLGESCVSSLGGERPKISAGDLVSGALPVSVRPARPSCP